MASKYNIHDVVEYRDKDGSIKMGKIMGENEHGYLIQPESIVPVPLAYSREELGKVVNADGSTSYSEHDYVLFRDKDRIKNGQIIGYNNGNYIIKYGHEPPGKEYSVADMSDVVHADGSPIDQASKYAQGVYVQYRDKNDHRPKIGHMIGKEGEQYIIQAKTIIPPDVIYSTGELIQVVTPALVAPVAPVAPALVAPEGAENLDEIETEVCRLLTRFQTKIAVLRGAPQPGKKTNPSQLQKIRKISLDLLESFMYITLDIFTGEQFNPITTIPMSTKLLRTYPSADPVLKGDIIFCNSMPLSNVQIRNKVLNDTVAVLETIRPLNLFNFIPISMIFGAQIKEGNSQRGIFSDCCELSVIRDFCRKHRYDGIILTDQADMYLFNNNEFLPPELHTGTACRDAMNIKALEDLTKKNSFLVFDGTGIGIGAMYPEFVIFDNEANKAVTVERDFLMKVAYCNPTFLNVNYVPKLIPINGDTWVVDKMGLICASDSLLNRQKYIGTLGKSRALPYLFDRRYSVVQARELANNFIEIYNIADESEGAEGAPAEGGKKTKKSKTKKSKTKKSKTKKSKTKKSKTKKSKTKKSKKSKKSKV
jgi:hypothetical protein